MHKSIILFILTCALFNTKALCQNLQLKINGNNEIGSRIIDSIGYSKTLKDYFSLTSEIDSLQLKLYKIGFIENQRTPINKENDSLYSVKINLKKKYNTIYIYYNKNQVNNSILNRVSKQVFPTYFVLPISGTEQALRFINSKISEKGYPFSKLHLSDIEILESENLKADLIIDFEATKRVINNIVIKGYEKFPKSFLKHYLKIKPNQIFDLQTIENKTEKLNDLKFANQIKAPEVLFTKDSTTLYMYIEKSKSNTFDGFLGFGTNEQTNKLDFYGYLNLNLTNNLNYGESFALQYKNNQNDQKWFQTDLSMPYFLKTPIGIDLQLHILKQDSTFTTVNQSAKLNYQINSKHKVYAGIKATESNNLLTESTNLSIPNYRSNYLTFAHQFIKSQRYNLLFPVKASTFFETGFGKRNISGSSERQTQLNLDAFKIFSLNQKNSIYIRVNGEHLISDSYFENELFRFGGINSIRGFEENSLLATSYGFFNTEYRLQISKNIYIHSIIDMAYLENKIINAIEKLYGYGFGFAILSNTGLFKLNYANGTSNNQKFKFANSKIHLSLIADF